MAERAGGTPGPLRRTVTRQQHKCFVLLIFIDSLPKGHIRLLIWLCFAFACFFLLATRWGYVNGFGRLEH